MNGLRAATVAFRDVYLHPDGADAVDLRSDYGVYDQWSRVESRRLRYAILWACYSNDQYRDMHKWARKYRSDFGLYRNTRSIFGPFYRLAEMQVTHIQGGPLDPKAGDGKSVPSAIPILTEDQILRDAIARLWRDSRWQSGKDIWTRWGSVLGDVGLVIEDDPIKGIVSLCPVHPRSIADVTMDRLGNVKGYCREEYRLDPRQPYDHNGQPRMVSYREECRRAEGELVHYETYLDGKPYAWNGTAAAWDVAYGFVPMVLAQHINVGLPWGLSEANAALSRSREIDDVGSKLNDQVRKLVEAPWIISGVNPGDIGGTQQTARNTTEGTSPQAKETDREQSLILYLKNENARAQAMVADLKISEVSDHLTMMLDQMERDYPELRFDRIRAGGDASGKALREARKPAETKIRLRRATYDESLVRAHQMAIAIGGMRGYDGYQGFGLESYAAGTLDHSIADRPIFEGDPMEDLEEEQLFWQTAKAAVDSGVPIDLWLERHGWAPDQIERVVKAQASAPTTPTIPQVN